MPGGLRGSVRSAWLAPVSRRSSTPLVVRVARAGFAALDVVALVIAVHDTANVAHYFSFFTIEANVVSVGVLAIGALRDPRSPAWAWVRAAATLYMTITGIVYAALLTGTDVGLLAPWVNDVLHRVTPAVLVLDYLLCGPWPRISYRAAAVWLVGPLAYLVYSLARGPVVDWYPYPFLDPRHAGGYWRVAGICVVLAVFMALLAAAVNWVGRRRLQT